MNLGELLKQNKEKADEAARKRTLEEQALHDEDAFIALQQVRFFFDFAFKLFEHRLLHAKEPGRVALGGREFRDQAHLLETYQWKIPFGLADSWRAGRGIWTPSHPLYSVWAEFEARCEAAGLAPQWMDAHDGVGIESWYELTVTSAS